jgi:hypothetical protein
MFDNRAQFAKVNWPTHQTIQQLLKLVHVFILLTNTCSQYAHIFIGVARILKEVFTVNFKDFFLWSRFSRSISILKAKNVFWSGDCREYSIIPHATAVGLLTQWVENKWLWWITLIDRCGLCHLLGILATGWHRNHCAPVNGWPWSFLNLGPIFWEIPHYGFVRF